MKKRSPSYEQNSQLVHWWVLAHKLLYWERVTIANFHNWYKLQTLTQAVLNVTKVQAPKIYIYIYIYICVRAAPPMLSTWPCNNISHIQDCLFIYLFIPNLTHKTGTAKGWRLLIGSNPPEPIKPSCQQTIEHSRFQAFLCPFTSLLCKNGGPKSFCMSKLAFFDFSSLKICS